MERRPEDSLVPDSAYGGEDLDLDSPPGTCPGWWISNVNDGGRVYAGVVGVETQMTKWTASLHANETFTIIPTRRGRETP